LKYLCKTLLDFYFLLSVYITKLSAPLLCWWSLWLGTAWW